MSQSKILLVTGASSEVGLALIEQVAADYDVILAHYCRSDKKLLELREKLGEKLELLQADFSDAESVRSMIAQIQEKGCSVNQIVHLAAPKLHYVRFAKSSWEMFEEGLSTCLQSVVEITKAFLPQMAKNKYGRIVFMLTSCTTNLPPKYLSSYVTVKYALLGLMKSLAVEYAEKGITVNGVSPDMMETRFLSEVSQIIVEQSAQNSPLGRNLTVQDAVPAFAYLLSDAAAAVTGQNLAITGGR